ncbi:hypothetical protein D9M72_574370 [compost metagenome]
MHDIARTQHGTVDGQMAVLDPACKSRAGVIGKELRGNLVETLAAQLKRHFGRELNAIGHEGTRWARGLLVSATRCG